MNDCVDVSAPVPADGGLDDLNRWLGRREAFGLMAGRCSAADVECMRQIRESKLYLKCTENWQEFCTKYLHMSKSNSNRLIGLLEKYGAEYFHITQITGISATAYEKIASSIYPDGIEADGVRTPLTPENGERVAAVVRALLEEKERETKAVSKEDLAKLEAAGMRLVKNYRQLCAEVGRCDPQLTSSVGYMRSEFSQLFMEVK